MFNPKVVRNRKTEGAIPVCHKTIIPHASSGILKEFHRMLSGSSG